MERAFVKTLFVSVNFMVAAVVVVKIFGFSPLVFYGFPVLGAILYLMLKRELS